MNKFTIIKYSSKKKPLIVNSSKLGNENILENTSFKDYIILSQLGKGGFGVVFKVKCKLNNKIYAMKILPLNSKTEVEKQLKTLKKYPHKNIVNYYVSFVHENYLYVILEYVRNCDLSEFIRVHNIKNELVRKGELWNIYYQCIEGLKHLHKNNIVHGDIKPNNIFIDNNLTVKLGDFGSSFINNEGEPKSFTYKYSAPELFDKKNRKRKNEEKEEIEENEEKKEMKKIDIFSMGATFFELYYLHPLLDVKTVIKNGGIKINIKKQKSKIEDYIYNAIISQYTEKIEDKKDKEIFAKRINEYIQNYEIEKDKKDLLKEELIPLIKNEKILDYLLVDIEKEKNIKNLIDKMTEINIKKRINSEEALSLVRTEIENYYFRNSSLGSVVKCLISYKNFIEEFKDILDNKIKTNNNNLIISKLIKDCYDFKIVDDDLDPWIDYINELRLNLNANNLKLGKFKEIDPKLVLSFIFRNLNEELFENKNINYNKNFYISSGTYNNEINEIETKINFEKIMNETNNSIIKKYFYGVIKHENICSECKIKTFNFNAYYFLIIKEKLSENINIQDLITSKIEIKETNNKIFCNKCLEIKEHTKCIEYISFPELLVISFDQGFQYEEKYGEFNEIRINDYVYNLIGYIEYIEKQKIYFPFWLEHENDEKSVWKYFLDYQFTLCEDNNYKDNIDIGQIKMLFYERVRKN